MGRPKGGDAFSIFDQLTAARAAMDDPQVKYEAGVDHTRLKREEERRERLGQLRAREHQGKRRFTTSHKLFG